MSEQRGKRTLIGQQLIGTLVGQVGGAVDRQCKEGRQSEGSSREPPRLPQEAIPSQWNSCGASGP